MDGQASDPGQCGSLAATQLFFVCLPPHVIECGVPLPWRKKKEARCQGHATCLLA